MSNIQQLLGKYITLSQNVENYSKQLQSMRNTKKSIEDKLTQEHNRTRSDSFHYGKFNVSIKKQQQLQTLTKGHIQSALQSYFTKKGYTQSKKDHYAKEIMDHILDTRSKQEKNIFTIDK